MKPTRNILFGFVVASTSLMAGSVTIPNSFTANTTAKASEVNANFSAVKTAVDGNAGDIATNKNDIADNANDIATNKADITTNANNIAGTITDINATGGLSGGGNSGGVTVRRADGYVSISSAAFLPDNESGCVMDRSTLAISFNTASSITNCKAIAPVSLPDGATLKSLTCSFYDHDGSAATAPQGELVRTHKVPLIFGGGATEYVLFKVATDGTDPMFGTRSETNSTIDDATHATVKNKDFKNALVYDPKDNTHTIGSNEKLYSCSIKYSYQ